LTDDPTPGSREPRQGESRVDILGIPVDRLTADQAVDRVRAFLRERRTAHVVTVNPEFVMTARGDPRFREVLAGSDLALADGIGIVWASRLLGHPLTERVAGVDIVPRLACAAAAEGGGVFLLGAAPGVAERAARVLTGLPCPEARSPIVVGTHAGSPAPEEADDIVARIRAAQPALLLVAFGSPRQDLWIAQYRQRLGVPVMMGVGGTFDFLTGVQRRAPAPVRRAGLEWLWRLALEPGRWRRQLALPHFALLVAADPLRRRRRGPEA
jgi:N-acetylglucosaminyldiphosphoundecaprenol N-acetyl-beta-D-mannosaminyltransferase